MVKETWRDQANAAQRAAYAEARKNGATVVEAQRVKVKAYAASRSTATRAGDIEAIETRRLQSARANAKVAEAIRVGDPGAIEARRVQNTKNRTKNRARLSTPGADPFDGAIKRC